MKNPKGKGNVFERDIAKVLSLWWSDEKDKYVFQRTQSSGAWSTLMKHDTSLRAQAGDITSIDERGRTFADKVFVEVKWYKKEDSIFYEALTGKRVQVLEWWKKCEGEAIDAGKQPVLIVKFNNRVPFILLTYEFYMGIIGKFGMPTSIKSACYMKLHFDDSVYNTIVAMKLTDWLTWCKPEFFKGEWEW
jgi:hypothetical protein